MHIHILQVTRPHSLRVNKDTNSGYGTVNDFGHSLIARMLNVLKNRTMNFPEILPAYLAAILKQEGYQVSYGHNEISPEAQIILIQSSIIYVNEEIAWAERIKHRFPHIRIGFVGGLASAQPAVYADHGDFVIHGEAENALRQGNIADFQGIVTGGWVEVLDDLPFPDWSHIQSWRKGYGFVRTRRGRCLPVLSSRGCPMACRYYCTYPLVQGNRFRSRSPHNVIDEIIHLQQTYQMDTVLFRDPIFTLDQDRIQVMCELILDRRLNFSWICETHPNLLTEELIALMARAGCVAIKFGIESGNLEIMHKSHRHIPNLSQQEAIVRKCEKNGIDVLGFYILGYRDDTRQTILQTIKYARKLNTFGAQFTIATPYPGTPWYEDLAKQPEIFTLDENFERYTQYRLVYKHPNIAYEEMEKLKSQAYQQYYLRPAYITKHLGKILRS